MGAPAKEYQASLSPFFKVDLEAPPGSSHSIFFILCNRVAHESCFWIATIIDVMMKQMNKRNKDKLMRSIDLSFEFHACSIIR